ncbi:UDP-glycosyltransferase 91A1-like [Tripterygium wilfordii]|uniref:UDP-glycosyltransferase 91A1-like n=1 Tax=Tripterygium wilfordii TaxID=458696 RepID=UPI0018F7EAD6|nr:UDP-glycosyltransferase 91A1-like [Tripterygium wilfordii]
MANEDHKLHIAMFPWLAFGHIIPYLELAKLLAGKGHKISFISTPKNIDRLPKLPPNIAPLVTFVKLPLPQVDNLPEDAEATSDLPFNKVSHLKLAHDGLQEPMTRFLQSADPDWILYDFSLYWLPPIARNLGIPNAFFSIFNAAMVSYVKPTLPSLDFHDDLTKLEDFTAPPKWVPFPTTESFRFFEVLRIFDSLAGAESDISDLARAEMVVRGCDAVLVRGCYEFEPEWLRMLEDIHVKPVLPVGELPTTANETDEETDTWRHTKQWLDKQERGSVVYVAFGSEAKPSQDELTEIALGLELSKLPFFWVLKTRRGQSDPDPIALPDGFEERTKGRGFIWTSWAPQLKILSHDSVGGFLTHSGWTSVVEAIQFEKALILLAFLAEQGINARILEEKKIGYLIPRNERDGSFTRESVAESVRLVMVEEEGQVYRDKVKEMKGLFGDSGIQERYVDNLLRHLQSRTRVTVK